MRAYLEPQHPSSYQHKFKRPSQPQMSLVRGLSHPCFTSPILLIALAPLDLFPESGGILPISPLRDRIWFRALGNMLEGTPHSDNAPQVEHTRRMKDLRSSAP